MMTDTLERGGGGCGGGTPTLEMVHYRFGLGITEAWVNRGKEDLQLCFSK
jgi:hypothetical protein